MSEAEHLPHRFEWRGRTVPWGRLGQGPPLVLLHGTPWSSALWQPIVRTLADRFTVHFYDMPGYGAASKDPGHAVDLGVQGELFADLLDHWGVTTPHVIAHDIGGAVALRARLLHGRRYASLCLVDVVALRPWGSPFFRLVQQNADVFSRLPAAIHRGVVEAYVAGAAFRELRADDLAMLVTPWLGPAGQSAFYRQIAEADEAYTEQVEAGLGSIDEPVHIVWGAEDRWIPPDRADRLRAAIPHATVRLVPGAGHLVQLDAPAELAGELTAWTGAVTDPGARP